MQVTIYTFEDEHGDEQSHHTYEPTEAEEIGRKNGWSVIANEYEWTESVAVPEWDFAHRLG